MCIERIGKIMKNYNIDDIEKLTIEEARQMALDTMEIKEHECIFVDFGGYFGYSVLVFKNGKHIHYADDFELHHDYIVKENEKEALKQWYIELLNHKLFTEAELLEEVTSYDEYEKKTYFLRNYWIMRYDYLSIFGGGDNAKPDFPFYDPVSFCYVADEKIIKTQTEIMEHLEAAYEKLKNNAETFREMVSSELANHEACITCDYTDALGALGMCFEELTEEKQKIVKEELGKQIHAYCEAE